MTTVPAQIANKTCETRVPSRGDQDADDAFGRSQSSVHKICIQGLPYPHERAKVPRCMYPEFIDASTLRNALGNVPTILPILFVLEGVCHFRVTAPANPDANVTILASPKVHFIVLDQACCFAGVCAVGIEWLDDSKADTSKTGFVQPRAQFS